MILHVQIIKYSLNERIFHYKIFYDELVVLTPIKVISLTDKNDKTAPSCQLRSRRMRTILLHELRTAIQAPLIMGGQQKPIVH